jgi:hypothetical protein
MGSEYGIVESILASVQWDRWKFMLSAPKLVKQDVAVISHGHRDHWATNLAEKDVVFIPREVEVPSGLSLIRNAIAVDYSEKIDKLRFIKLRRDRIANFIQDEDTPTPHAFWWLVMSKQTRTLFIGDLNVRDVTVARAFVAEMSKRDLPLAAAVLPSFGGVSSHDSKWPRQLTFSVEELGYDLRDVYGMVLGALPHPVNANWATYNASPIPSIERD